ncbi:MAG: exodeoxyribonuclease VII large subunit [Clostridiales bacterium]|jgi:exodeoxyribonuclease VII large subunit|nr:exodeoxyribonuclease VII large subunit [Clostridiales bacterium]
MEALTVTELNEIINRIFRSEEMLHGISVAGEVSGFKVSGAHAYFDLKDERSKVACCCFSCRRTYIPKNGEFVVVRATPDYWIEGGRLSLKIDGIEPYGLGLLFQKIEALKVKLTALGIFDEAKKKTVPRYADKVCVVTSRTGAVIHDIIRTIRKKNTIIDITVADVRVQGEKAAAEIARALKNVDKLGFDVVILARGGGSVEDLMPFNDEEVAMAVFSMNTPIISAVGHETDFSISDMAADLRAPTPTWAAEYIAYDEKALKDAFSTFLYRGKQKILNAYEFKKLSLISAMRELSACANKTIADRRGRLFEEISALKNAAQTVVLKKENALNGAAVALDKSSPLKRLASGYFKIEKNGAPVSRVTELKKDDEITVFGADGNKKAIVS